MCFLRFLLLMGWLGLLLGCERKVGHGERGEGADGLRAVSRVVGYRFVLPGEDEPDLPMPSGFSLIQRDGMVDFDLLDELKRAEIVLKGEQIDSLVAAVYGGEKRVSSAACYDPHHIFLFYDGEGEICNVVEVCFSCYSIRTMPELQEEQWGRHDFRALARFCEEVGLGLGRETAEEFIQRFDEREGL